jgi:hypothetical protein
MSFDYKKVANINIKMTPGTWDPDKQNIVVSRDEKSSLGFSVKIVPVEDEAPIVDLTQANAILQKFRKQT